MAWKTISGVEVQLLLVAASMGPRFNGVEDSGRRGGFRGANWLQWGHALMAWKTQGNSSERIPERPLQWGHALMAWKTSTTSAGLCSIQPASMGPRFNGVEDASHC